MNIKDYRKRKADKKIEFRVLGEKSVMAFSANYDAATGKKLDDSASHLNLDGMKVDLVNLDKQIAELQDLRADLTAAIADVEGLVNPTAAKK